MQYRFAVTFGTLSIKNLDLASDRRKRPFRKNSVHPSHKKIKFGNKSIVQRKSRLLLYIQKENLFNSVSKFNFAV